MSKEQKILDYVNSGKSIYTNDNQLATVGDFKVRRSTLIKMVQKNLIQAEIKYFQKFGKKGKIDRWVEYRFYRLDK